MSLRTYEISMRDKQGTDRRGTVSAKNAKEAKQNALKKYGREYTVLAVNLQ